MFNPISASKNIKEEFVGYIATSFSFADKNLIDRRAIRSSLPSLLFIPSQSPPIME